MISAISVEYEDGRPRLTTLRVHHVGELIRNPLLVLRAGCFAVFPADIQAAAADFREHLAHARGHAILFGLGHQLSHSLDRANVRRLALGASARRVQKVRIETPKCYI